MVFKSNRQRKFVMAKLRAGNRVNVNPRIIGRMKITTLKEGQSFKNEKFTRKFFGKKKTFIVKFKVVPGRDLGFTNEKLLIESTTKDGFGASGKTRSEALKGIKEIIDFADATRGRFA